MAVTLDSVLWYGSLVVLAIALLPLGEIHPIIRYALGATSLVVILFFMGDDDGVRRDEVVPLATGTDAANNATNGAGETNNKSSGELEREQLKDEIKRKIILNDASRAAASGSGSAAPPASNDNNDNGASDSGEIEEDQDLEGKDDDGGDDDDDDDDVITNGNTWRCACENGFLPPGLLKNFGGAEAVMRMGMGQCYHKGAV